MLSGTEVYYLEGGGSLELSTITAGQAKWTARWQTRIPGQRTIEAWTRLHMVLAGQREGIHLVLPLRDRSWTQERPLQRSTLHRVRAATSTTGIWRPHG